MKIIHDNPYRIAGILSNATAKEFEKQKRKIRANAKMAHFFFYLSVVIF